MGAAVNDLEMMMWLVSDIPAMVWVARLVRRYRNPHAWERTLRRYRR